MKFVIFAGALAALALPATAGNNAHTHSHHTHKHAHAHTHAHHTHESGPAITVSCYRGPWEDVIWDRPNPVFVDSLVTVGYDINTASSIAERICRDPDLVGDTDGLKAEMKRIYREIPRTN